MIRASTRGLPRGALASIVIVAALAVSSCAPLSAAPEAAVTASLQQSVLGVTRAIAADDWGSATAELDALEAQVDAAVTAGDLTEERAAEIRAAFALVRADVAAGIEQSTPEEPVETEEPDPDDSDDDDSDKPGNRGENRNDKKDDD